MRVVACIFSLKISPGRMTLVKIKRVLIFIQLITQISYTLSSPYILISILYLFITAPVCLSVTWEPPRFSVVFLHLGTVIWNECGLCLFILTVWWAFLHNSLSVMQFYLRVDMFPSPICFGLCKHYAVFTFALHFRISKPNFSLL